MFDWKLFITLIGVCIPGMLVALSNALNTMRRLARQRMPADQALPPLTVMFLASFLQSLLLVAVAAAVGTALAPRVGLQAPFFEALVAGQPLGEAVGPQILPALLLGVAGALVFVVAYYLYFRPRLDRQTVERMEELRNSTGAWGRVLYGGVVEEVLVRWGLMSLLAWLGTLLAGVPTPVVMWGAILVSGILFGLGHLPGYLAAGCRKTNMFLAAALTLNLGASLIFGWLFWQVGLLAAMVAHALFHLVWLPFDRRYYRPYQPASTDVE